MGYYVSIQESTATIPAANLDKAYKAMCELNNNDSLKRGGSFSGDRVIETWFSWMPANYPETCSNAAEILEELGFDCVFNESGGLDVLYYDNKSGQEDLFFNAMAPFIEPGGYIIWTGEDGDMWRWYFDGKTMRVMTPKEIVWA